ncbi:hypothetical protein GQ44DRAFT_243285 [Phaeosphaeriaceae sp. PMI808]|nr:hypothetical protein GQ44DRAFT_243285 [Phaeosphaeriaceae sp. PMI808]
MLNHRLKIPPIVNPLTRRHLAAETSPQPRIHRHASAHLTPSNRAPPADNPDPPLARAHHPPPTDVPRTAMQNRPAQRDPCRNTARLRRPAHDPEWGWCTTSRSIRTTTAQDAGTHGSRRRAALALFRGRSAFERGCACEWRSVTRRSISTMFRIKGPHACV